MATLAELYAEINRWNKDRSLTQYYLAEINNCLETVAMLETPLILLPSLQTSSTITTPYRELAYTTGSSVVAVPVAGDTVTGGTSGATGTIGAITKDSGLWVTGTAAGTLYIDGVSGTFIDGETLTVGTGTAVADGTLQYIPYATLPTNYGKHLYYVISTDQGSAGIINIRQSLRVILDERGSLDNDGDVTDVCVVGTSLYMQPIPDEVDTLTVYYYRKPSAVTYNDSTDLSCIPSEYQKRIIPFYVLRNLSVDNPQAWQNYNTMYEMGLAQLAEYVKPKMSKQVQHTKRYAEFY